VASAAPWCGYMLTVLTVFDGLRAVLESLGAVLGAPGARSGCPLEQHLRGLGASLSCLGLCRCGLRRVLLRPWSSDLGHAWGGLDESWGRLGAALACLEGSLGRGSALILSVIVSYWFPNLFGI